MSAELRNSIGANLSTVQSLYGDLQREAEYRYADKEFPGGDALVHLGPVANLEAFNYRQLSEMMGRTDGGSGVDDLETDPAPALLVLAGWADVVAVEKGDDRSERASVDREVRYLRSVLDWIVGSNADDEPYFLAADELDRDLTALRYRLEAVLKDGVRVTHGVPCLHCVGVDLVRIEDARLGLQDKYLCPKCGRDYKKEAYDFAVGTAHLAHATELTAAQIETKTSIPATRVRVWGSRKPELKCGRNPEGLFLYDVAGVVARAEELAKEKETTAV